ncbi:MAG TPA: DUF1330 domain-containing protein [Xanthobacteraceae bacterium]|nr:DUF1330 domain-containing protein [Xanthobacteraceae bacterium]
MPVMIIAQLRFRDIERYRKYQSQFSNVFGKFNGKLLVADEKVQAIEGSDCPDKIVVLEFPDSESAEQFHNSLKYREISEDRKAGAHALVVQVKSFHNGGTFP